MTEFITGIPVPAGGLIIGEDVITDSSRGTYDHVFAGTGEINARISLAGAEEVDRAVRAGARAQRDWMRFGGEKRRDVLNRLADLIADQLSELTQLSVHDNAVPITVSGLQPSTLLRYVRYYAGWADKAHGESAPGTGYHDLNLIEREPYGVVGVIMPWNGPLFQIGMNVIPAVAAGNAVVLKPSELAPLTSLRFGELCLAAGMPAGLVSVIPGTGEAGDALVRHRGVGKIHFTGSGPTARKILCAASENMTPVAAELGGKAANIVFADADLDAVVLNAGMSGPLGLSGQSCAAGNRILVQDTVYDEFVEKFVGVVAGTPFGDPFGTDTLVGPVISAGAADRIMGAIDAAVEKEMGTLIRGGRRAGGDLAHGYFIEPTIFGEVDAASPLAQQEVFGPVASLMRFSTEDEAIATANDTVYGLVNYVNTNDLSRAHRVARQLESGTVWINQGTDISPTGPYGGYKQSGMGRSGGVEGLHQFMQVKNIRVGIAETS